MKGSEEYGWKQLRRLQSYRSIPVHSPHPLDMPPSANKHVCNQEVLLTFQWYITCLSKLVSPTLSGCLKGADRETGSSSILMRWLFLGYRIKAFAAANVAAQASVTDWPAFALFSYDVLPPSPSCLPKIAFLATPLKPWAILSAAAISIYSLIIANWRASLHPLVLGSLWNKIMSVRSIALRAPFEPASKHQKWILFFKPWHDMLPNFCFFVSVTGSPRPFEAKSLIRHTKVGALPWSFLFQLSWD